MNNSRLPLVLLASLAVLGGCDEPTNQTAIGGRAYDLGDLPTSARATPPAASTELRPWDEVEAEVSEKLAHVAVRTNGGQEMTGAQLLDQLTADVQASAATVFVPAEGTFGPVTDVGGLYTCVMSDFFDSGTEVDPGNLPTISVISPTEFVIATPIPEAEFDFLLPPALDDEIWFEEHCTLGGYGNRFFQCSSVDFRLDLRPFVDFATGNVQQRSGVFWNANTAFTSDRVHFSCEGSECDGELATDIAFADNMPCTDLYFGRVDIEPE